MNLSDYTASLRKLSVGGGQDRDETGAARASCLPRVMEVFVFPPKIVQRSKSQCFSPQLGGLVPLGHVGCMSGSLQPMRHCDILLALPLFFSVNCDLKIIEQEVAPLSLTGSEVLW